jgi:hypothetical protein
MKTMKELKQMTYDEIKKEERQAGNYWDKVRALAQVRKYEEEEE